MVLMLRVLIEKKYVGETVYCYKSQIMENSLKTFIHVEQVVTFFEKNYVSETEFIVKSIK